jgi:hypothetical protein
VFFKLTVHFFIATFTALFCQRRLPLQIGGRVKRANLGTAGLSAFFNH